MSLRKTALFFLSAITLTAGEIQFNGNFSKTWKDGTTPSGWVLHDWKGYKPYAEMKVRKTPEGNVLQLRKIQGTSGSVVRTAKMFPCLSGDRIEISFQSKGKGTGNIGIYGYTEKGGWNRVDPVQKYPLTKEMSSHFFSFTVPDGYSGETHSFRLCFGAAKGGELDLAQVKCKVVPGKYRGNVPFPNQWTMFGPVSENFKPESLESIPETLNGIKGKKVRSSGHKIDFAALLPKPETTGWVFGEIDSPYPCHYTIGAGADWWMELYVNGKKVADTMAKGNEKTPVDIENYLCSVTLKKGKNVIAVKMKRGKAGALLHIAGPGELRARKADVKLLKIRTIEDFEGTKRLTNGNFKLIQGYPTPGLLSLTGQGVLDASSPVRFQLKGEETLTLSPKTEEYAAAGLRIQNFGAEKKTSGSLCWVYRSGKNEFVCSIKAGKDSDTLTAEFQENGKLLMQQVLPVSVLPADFMVSASKNGNCALTVHSLADSSIRCFQTETTFFKGLKNADFYFLFKPEEKNAQIVVDNILAGTAGCVSGKSSIPFLVAMDAQFDPVKAGWKLVFSDEFNGKEIDTTKWSYSMPGSAKRVFLRDGKLVIRAELNEKTKKPEAGGLWTKQQFLYGYFEAKVRFRKEYGWWAAFWLCRKGHFANAFTDGFEIDIFEDYYLRSKVPGGQPSNVLDHNLHISTSGVLKSWNYRSILPGSIHDFYVIGCKWTPFGISYYLNGKHIASKTSHSPYNRVTFDAFHHGTGLTPLHAILSGQCGRSGGDPKYGKFPEEYLVDYIRIYEYPEKRPSIKVNVKGAEGDTLAVGDKLHFSVKAEPNQETKAKIRTVYLMDSGFVLDHRTEPPYEFTLPLTEEYFSLTSYHAPGRTGQKLDFRQKPHAFCCAVQDEKGQVAFSELIVRDVYDPKRISKPYKGKAAVIPGTIHLEEYDEGGEGIAYCDTTSKNIAGNSRFRTAEGVDTDGHGISFVERGEWVNYTVDVQKAGKYTFRIRYGTPLEREGGVILMADGKILAHIPLLTHKGSHYRPDTDAVVSGIVLPEGRTVLKLKFMRPGVNFSTMSFEAE